MGGPCGFRIPMTRPVCARGAPKRRPSNGCILRFNGIVGVLVGSLFRRAAHSAHWFWFVCGHFGNVCLIDRIILVDER